MLRRKNLRLKILKQNNLKKKKKYRKIWMSLRRRKSRKQEMLRKTNQ